jgi:hypothetical protein
MLIWGTANPTGECNDTYHGVYLKHQDIDVFVNDICNKPVKVEHVGDPVGKVVHAWKNAQHGLDCIMEVDERSLNGAIISSLVDHECAKELSLGYRVRLNMSALPHSSSSSNREGTAATSSGENVCLEKEVVEVSIVKRGMRPNCKIHGFCRT